MAAAHRQADLATAAAEHCGDRVAVAAQVHLADATLACSASLASGNNWPSCTPRTLAFSAVLICGRRASMRIVLRMSPPATPVQRVQPQHAVIQQQVRIHVVQRQRRALMRWAFQRTSASMARSLPRL